MPDMTQQDLLQKALRIRAKLAGLTPEQRIEIGLGTRPDSMKVGLIPRVSGYDMAQQRVETGQGTPADSVRVGLKPRPRAFTAKEEAMTRLQIPQARRDSLLAGVPREKPEKAKEPSEKKQSLMALVRSKQITQAQADSIMGGVKREDVDKKKKKAKVGLIEKGAGYAKKLADFDKQLHATRTGSGEEINALRKKILDSEDLSADDKNRRLKELQSSKVPSVTPGSAAERILTKSGAVYADSSAIVARALERFTPDTDLNELIETIPIAKQAWTEFVQLSQRGGGSQAAVKQAAQVIQQKYGIDIETLRNVLYVETGK